MQRYSKTIYFQNKNKLFWFVLTLFNNLSLVTIIGKVTKGLTNWLSSEGMTQKEATPILGVASCGKLCMCTRFAVFGYIYFRFSNL